MKLLGTNLNKLILLSCFVIQEIIYKINSYTFTEEYLKVNPECNTNVLQQSPVDININNTLYFEEKMFRIANTNTTLNDNNNWTQLKSEQSFGFEGDLGDITLIKDWSAFLFKIEKILFRAKSAHKINDKFYDVEMQIVGSLDESYKTTTRYIYPSAKKLVFSLFLAASDIKDIEYSKILDFMNLEGYYNNLFPENSVIVEQSGKSESVNSVVISQSKDQTSASEVSSSINNNISTDTNTKNNVSPKSKVKLGNLIRHDNQFLYEGRLDYGKCDKAWYILNPEYQVITKYELSMIKNIISKLNSASNNDTNNNSNTRDIQNVIESTVAYRNYKGLNETIQVASYLQFTSNEYLNFSFILLAITLLLSIIN